MANGIIVIDKGQDWTSMDVCAKLRRTMNERRIGHAGTLDPMATGVLPVFVGRATRAVEFSSEGEKEYVAGLRLGLTTDTQDTSGETLSISDIRPDSQAVSAVLDQFRGDILQIPPMYSAIKINGKKLYDLARKGKVVEREPRPVTIHSLVLERQTQEGDYLLRIRCSKGTYIRTLCHDIGALLGCGGCMSSLRRTMAAGFTLEEAVTLDEVLNHPDPQSLLTNCDRCFKEYATLTCTDHQRDKFIKNGTPYPCDAPDGSYRVYDIQGDFLMLGQCVNGEMKTIKSFFLV